MRTANRVKPKTDFGIEVRLFTAQTGMTVKELAERSGVKYTTLIETTTGRCAGHQLIPDGQLQFELGRCLGLQRHAVEHDSCGNAVAGGEALGRHIRLGLPRRRIRRRHILHRELERTYQFRPRLAEPANLGRHHIVEHAGASAVTGQTGAEHRGSCAATVAVAVDSCVPRWLKHGSHHRAWRRQHALGLVHWL